MAITLLGTLGDFGNLTAAVGALGTAASSLVDVTKAVSGGVSNIGFSFIRDAVKPFQVALNSVNPEGGLETIRSNWLSGMAPADQLPAAKALIRLGATSANAAELALTMPNLDSAAFVAAITKSNAGQKLDPQDKAVLQIFDDSVGARLSAVIARADQKYKNSAKAIASVFAIARHRGRFDFPRRGRHPGRFVDRFDRWRHRNSRCAGRQTLVYGAEHVRDSNKGRRCVTETLSITLIAQRFRASLRLNCECKLVDCHRNVDLT